MKSYVRRAGSQTQIERRLRERVAVFISREFLGSASRRNKLQTSAWEKLKILRRALYSNVAENDIVIITLVTNFPRGARTFPWPSRDHCSGRETRTRLEV